MSINLSSQSRTEIAGSLLSEINEQACVGAARTALKPKGLEKNPELVEIIASVIRSERVRKIQLHQQWERRHQVLRDKVIASGMPISL